MAIQNPKSYIRCPMTDGRKWLEIEVDVDGKIFPCCHFLLEGISPSQPYEESLLNKWTPLCEKKCSVS